MSGTLAARLSIRRRLLVFSRSISLYFCMDVFTRLEDGGIRKPELICPVSKWNARELIWKLNQSLDERDMFVAQILVVQDNAELRGFRESCELLKDGVIALFGCYGFGWWTPNWTTGFEAERECANLWTA
jgi:hypothetical protein